MACCGVVFRRSQAEPGMLHVPRPTSAGLVLTSRGTATRGTPASSGPNTSHSESTKQGAVLKATQSPPLLELVVVGCVLVSAGAAGLPLLLPHALGLAAPRVRRGKARSIQSQRLSSPA